MLSAPQLVTGLSPLRFRCGALIALTRATCDVFSANFGKRALFFQRIKAAMRFCGKAITSQRYATCWASAENGDFYC